MCGSLIGASESFKLSSHGQDDALFQPGASLNLKSNSNHTSHLKGHLVYHSSLNTLKTIPLVIHPLWLQDHIYICNNKYTIRIRFYSESVTTVFILNTSGFWSLRPKNRLLRGLSSSRVSPFDCESSNKIWLTSMSESRLNPNLDLSIWLSVISKN